MTKVGADLKDLDALVQIAAQAQTDALKTASDNRSRLSYRGHLESRRDELMKQVDSALRDGVNVTDLPVTSELKRVDALLADTNAWYVPFEAQLREIANREKVARQLIAETRVALTRLGCRARAAARGRAHQAPSQRGRTGRERQAHPGAGAKVSQPMTAGTGVTSHGD